MKQLIFLIVFLTLVFSAKTQTKETTLIHFDGFYQTVCDIDSTERDTTISFLRFYPDGKVISASLGEFGNVNDLKKWFNLRQKNPSLGFYTITGTRIYFTTTSNEGTVVYDGQIQNNYYLDLTVKSLINGFLSNEKYYFIRNN